MHNNATSTAPHFKPTVKKPSMPSDDFPLMLEDLRDADDFDNYVEHMFSRKKPALTREEERVCDMATD